MTAIEWTDVTWNPVTGCTKVSQGCKHCYAESVAQRFWKGRKFTDVQTHPDRLDQPLRWRKPRRVFVNSMSDLFHEAVPDEFVDDVFSIALAAPRHAFQVLTKRPQRMREYMRSRAAALRDPHGEIGQRVFDLRAALNSIREWPPPNVWLGVSCEDQATAEERIPLLLDTPAAVRFVSCEPLLGPIDLYNGDPDPRLGGLRATQTLIGDWWEPGDDPKGPPRHGLDWIIVGGESGAGARPCDVAWIRSIVEQCRVAGVPCFVKQLGARAVFANTIVNDWPEADWRAGETKLLALGLRDPKGGDPAEWPEDLRVREWPKEAQPA